MRVHQGAGTSPKKETGGELEKKESQLSQYAETSGETVNKVLGTKAGSRKKVSSPIWTDEKKEKKQFVLTDQERKSTYKTIKRKAKTNQPN